MANVKDVRQNMSNITIDIGGRTRVIRYDANAFAELEARYGSVQKAMAALQTSQMKGIIGILWAGLIHEEVVLDEHSGEPIKYNISPYQVGSWITPNLIPVVSAKIDEAIRFGMPDNIEEVPGVQEELAKHGFEIRDGQVQHAKVVPTPEEEAKNV